MKRLVLLGGGHSHAAVLKGFGEKPVPGVELVLVSPGRHTPYSGMIPGLIAGDYNWDQCHIDLAGLSAFARARFLDDRVVEIDPLARSVALAAGGAPLEYDLLSIDIGSRPAGAPAAGESEHVVSIKPIDRFLLAVDALCGRARDGALERIAVVGAGAAGVEVALTLQHRLRRDARTPPGFVLVTDAPYVLPSHHPRVRAIVVRVLRERGIEVMTGTTVSTPLEAEGGLVLADGTRVPADVVIKATGAAAPAWLGASSLALDARGFIAIDEGLRSISHANVYAAGDCATNVKDPKPKSGVIAVRQGPALEANLRRELAGEAPIPFVTSSRALALLNCGNRHAVASWEGIALEGRWVWHWKDRIDRRFIARYRNLQIP